MTKFRDINETCAVCFRPHSEHCVFTPIKLPEGCKCEDPWDWGNPANIPAVCKQYNGDPKEFCETCEHEYQCHTP